MKRILLTLAVCALMATPVLANPTAVSPHLGWWLPGAPGSTHQYWTFTANVVQDGATYDWIASPPTEIQNTAAAAMIGNGDDTVIYDSINGWFTNDRAIAVVLNIKNYPPNAYKEIWVDIGFTGILTAGDADGIGPGTYITTVLPPFSDPEGVAELGFRIVPNPTEELVSFIILPIPPLYDPSGELIHGLITPVLDWIHVDTICIPAPGAIALGSIGVAFVGWLRRRRML